MRLLAAALVSAVLALAAPVPDSRYAHLARGVNLTRWFQYGSHQSFGPRERDLLKNAGFTAVRIPVAPQYLLNAWASPGEIAANLERLDRGIDLFLDAGIAVTLDFQADAEYLDYLSATPGAAGELIETWRMLSARYAGRNPELLFFEIMNEPDSRFTQAAWDSVQAEALRVIRENAPSHTVLLAPVGWSGLESLLRMEPYADGNVLYVLHYYSPTEFTHQGATWTGQPGIAALRSVPWPAFLAAPEPADRDAAERLARYQAEDWDEGHIEWDFSLVARWARERHVRVIVDEFGAYKPFTAPESRARWLHDVRAALEKNGLAWAVWDYAAGFDVVEDASGTPRVDPLVASALGLGPWTPETLRRPGMPAFTGPRTVQIGAAKEQITGPGSIDASQFPFVVLTPGEEGPVQLFAADGRGVLEPRDFAGRAPVVASAPVIVGHFDQSGKPGYFLPGPTSHLLLPSGNTLIQSSNGLLPGRNAATFPNNGTDDLVLFGDRTEFLANDGHGRFHAVPGAIPPQDKGFVCGVFQGGRLHVFAEGVAKRLRSRGHGRFAEEGAFALAGGLGSCSAAAAGPDEIVVGWSNGALQVLTRNGDETAARIGEPPQMKQGIRQVSFLHDVLLIERIGEPPLVYRRDASGHFKPLEFKAVGRHSIVALADLNRDGKADLLYPQGGDAPLLARFGR